MRTCSKPCNGDIGRDLYMADVRAARDFIEGREGPLLAELDTAIGRLSEELRFEEALEVQKRAERIREARRSHKATHFPIEDFHAIVLLNSGSVRTRKIAHVRNGRIDAFEEHECRTMAETLGAAVARPESDAPDTVEEDRYEDFCLVARFIFRPLESVRVFSYRDENEQSALDEALRRAGT
jgi:excinuclease UvrABC nuclease subunit